MSQVSPEAMFDEAYRQWRAFGTLSYWDIDEAGLKFQVLNQWDRQPKGVDAWTFFKTRVATLMLQFRTGGPCKTPVMTPLTATERDYLAYCHQHPNHPPIMGSGRRWFWIGRMGLPGHPDSFLRKREALIAFNAYLAFLETRGGFVVA